MQHSSKPLLNQGRSSIGHARIQLRHSFQKAKARNARRPGLEPDPLEHLRIESGPLNAKGLVKPFFFAVGVRKLLFISINDFPLSYNW